VNDQLDALRFSALGLLGEVRLAQDPDYEKWGIEILVSFRDNEPLKVLTAQRQSGGVGQAYVRLFITLLIAVVP
jgi:hypothetical protein